MTPAAWIIVLTLADASGASRDIIRWPLDGADVRLTMVCALQAQAAAAEYMGHVLGGDRLHLARWLCKKDEGEGSA